MINGTGAEVEERIVLSKEQAISLLADNGDDEYIHTFLSVPGSLIGADWARREIIAEIYLYPCEIGGEECRSVGHGLVIKNDRVYPLFVQTKPGALEELVRKLKKQK